MAVFAAEDIDKYGGQQSGGFFSLKDDKDTAQIRFMYNNFQDILGYTVHEIEIDGKKRYVSCLREYNQDKHVCPFCAREEKIVRKLFLQVYDLATQEVKIWERSAGFAAKIGSLCARYNPLVATPFEIERNGKKGDMKTTYEAYALATDNVRLEELPPHQEIMGGFVLEKSYEELEFFIQNGYFPEPEPVPAPGQVQPVERNPVQDRRPVASQQNQGITRRVPPANNNTTRDIDRF